MLPFNEAERAVRIASQNLIAVVGIEAFRILAAGFDVETYSGYEFEFDGNRVEYVRLNNDAALRFIEENIYGAGYDYILTTASEREFKKLPTQL